MKAKIACLLVTLFLVGGNIYSQSDSTKFIANTWKLTQKSLPLVADFRLEQMKKSNPAMADQIDVQMIKDGLSQSTFKYNADGTYESSSPQATDGGTWKLSDDKKSLITKSTASGRENTRMIVRISEKVLSLKLSETLIADFEPVIQ